MYINVMFNSYSEGEEMLIRSCGEEVKLILFMLQVIILPMFLVYMLGVIDGQARF